MAKVDTLVGVRALPEIPDGTEFNTAWEKVTMSDSAGSAMSFYGTYVWSHNGEMYLNATHKWDKASQTWLSVEWFLPGSDTAASFYGSNIFAWDGDVYLTNSGNVYKLPAGYTGNTWQSVTVNLGDLTSIPGVSDLWIGNDGGLFYTTYTRPISGEAYLSAYEISKGSDGSLTLTAKKWYESSDAQSGTEVMEMYGNKLWADMSGNIYDADGCRQMKYGSLIISSSGFGVVEGYYLAPADTFAAEPGKRETIWSDGTNVYYVKTTQSGTMFNPTYTYTYYKFDETSKAWVKVTLGGNPPITYGSYVWTDGTNLYYSGGTTHYKLAALPKDINPCYLKENGEWVKKDVFQLQNGEWVQISFKG